MTVLSWWNRGVERIRSKIRHGRKGRKPECQPEISFLGLTPLFWGVKMQPLSIEECHAQINVRSRRISFVGTVSRVNTPFGHHKNMKMVGLAGGWRSNDKRQEFNGLPHKPDALPVLGCVV